MDQEYKPILSEEERAARRAQRAASRRKKQRERRLRLLRGVAVPCKRRDAEQSPRGEHRGGRAG